MIRLSDKWHPVLDRGGETGMGYSIATVVLKDGREFKQAAIIDVTLAEIRGLEAIPFAEDDIERSSSLTISGISMLSGGHRRQRTNRTPPEFR